MKNKLCSKNKELVTVGTILKQSNGVTYEITSIVRNGNKTNITTLCSLSGTHIYFQPLSSFYGLEIINN